jgi:hypothetical protein
VCEGAGVRESEVVRESVRECACVCVLSRLG